MKTVKNFYSKRPGYLKSNNKVAYNAYCKYTTMNKQRPCSYESFMKFRKSNDFAMMAESYR